MVEVCGMFWYVICDVIECSECCGALQRYQAAQEEQLRRIISKFYLDRRGPSQKFPQPALWPVVCNQLSQEREKPKPHEGHHDTHLYFVLV
jgi:hypothetical protein